MANDRNSCLSNSCLSMVSARPPWRPVSRLTQLAVVIALIAGNPDTAPAQTDYFNTDAGRPVRIEDAYAVERRAFEIQLAPLRLERSSGGRYQWGIEPELAYGILPRTHIEIGTPLAYVDGLDEGTAGLAGIDVSLFHNLNVETAVPAFAIVASGLLPAGHLGPDKAYGTLKAIMTRTFRWARVHVNGEYTIGDAEAESADTDTPEGSAVAELSRWMAGVAVDRTLPLRSLLLTAEVFAEEPLQESGDLRWNTGLGVRYQLSPRFNVDAGLGRRLTGDDQSWHVTFGAAVGVGLPWHP